MLKHVQISPLRNRSDSLSMRSTTSCASSLCGSPEPPTNEQLRNASRASSYCSLNETIPPATIRVFTGCLRLDIEYKTLGIQWDTTSKEVITQILKRCKLRHRDPRLFYLSMEVTVRRAGVRTVLVLDEEARPAILQACHPKGDSRFCLQLKPGGLIRVHTQVLQPSSQYKSLVISEETTSDELLSLLLLCYNSCEPVEQFSIYEVCPGQEYQRKLHPDDIPLKAQIQRLQRGEKCHFLVRRNPHYPRRKHILPPIIEQNSSNTSINQSLTSIAKSLSSSSVSSTSSSSSPSISSLSSSTPSLTTLNVQKCETNCKLCPPQQQQQQYDNLSENSIENVTNNEYYCDNNNNNNNNNMEICEMCKNNFKSCEFCNKNTPTKLSTRSIIPRSASSASSASIRTILPTSMMSTPIIRGTSASTTTTYNPVYNIREIRTVCNSFSSLGIDKKLFDIEHSNKIKIDNNNNINNNNNNNNNTSILIPEIVNNNPSQGYGNFIYI